ncbi:MULTISPECIES: hypothetical protein [unclassified Bartonella]|uniref:hypothetical protein n=1 Tax=unclassified Bartonella TaxID=2645622 RepID=UPI0035CF4E46
MLSLSLACDDQQSAILAFSWNGGTVPSIQHFNIVHRCFNEAVTGNINRLMSFFIVNKSIERGE